MPQPLSKVRPNYQFLQYGNVGDRPFEERPRLGILAMAAIASWSNVETFMLHAFVELLGGQQSLAADVYVALDGKAAKNAAIEAAAKRALADSPELQQVFWTLLSIVKSAQKERDKLAHWQWGTVSDLPDALILVDPRKDYLESSESDPFVYRERDLTDLITRNNEICGLLLQFRAVLKRKDRPAGIRALTEIQNHNLVLERTRATKAKPKPDDAPEQDSDDQPGSG